MSHSSMLVSTSGDGVRTLTLNRPERLNAVHRELADELPRQLDAAAEDDAVRVVVLTGAGRAFCAGLDLTDPALLGTNNLRERLDALGWVGRWVLAVTECEKPVIAALNGVAAGAGFGLALAADVRLIAQGATLTAGYIRRALTPDAGVSFFLPRLVGAARAMDILLTGRDITAEEAERIGLVSRVLPGDRFAEEVAEYARRIAQGPPLALARTKRLVHESASNDLRSQLRAELTQIKECFATQDATEAIAAFGAKRAPVFTGQ